MRITGLMDCNDTRIIEGSKVQSIYNGSVHGIVKFGKYKTGCTCDKYTDSQYGFYILDNNGNQSSLYGYRDELWFEVIE
jgi:hypothetical protein